MLEHERQECAKLGSFKEAAGEEAAFGGGFFEVASAAHGCRPAATLPGESIWITKSRLPKSDAQFQVSQVASTASTSPRFRACSVSRRISFGNRTMVRQDDRRMRGATIRRGT